MVRDGYSSHEITIPQINDPTKTVSKDVFQSETLHTESGMIGFTAPDKIIATGKVILVDSLSVIRGEGAASDTLDFIEFGTAPDIKDKDLVWIQQGAEQITIAHNTSTPPANSGPILLLSKADKKMIGTRMILLQRQGTNFQEIVFDGTVGNTGVLVEDDSGNAIIVCGSVASAVNHLKITNAATGNDVTIEPISATDANINIRILPKGTGTVYGTRETWGYPLTDETTLPTTGVKYVSEPAPYDMSIEDAIIGLTIAGTGATLFSIDVLKENSVNGNAFTTIFSTLPTIDASEFTSTTAAIPKVISVSTWEKGRRLQLSISAIDSNSLGRGAKIELITHATAK